MYVRTATSAPVEAQTLAHDVLLLAPISRTTDCDGQRHYLEPLRELADGELELLLHETMHAYLPLRIRLVGKYLRHGAMVAHNMEMGGRKKALRGRT